MPVCGSWKKDVFEKIKKEINFVKAVVPHEKKKKTSQLDL